MPSTDDTDHWPLGRRHDDHRLLGRRHLLGALGTGATLALAGCVGDDDDEETDDDDSVDDTATGDDADDEETDDTDDAADGDDPDDAQQLAEPTEFPEGEECAVCNMVAAEHPAWNAQLVHEDEQRVYFCSSGCLLAYAMDSEHFGGPATDVEGVWVTDYETGDLVDGLEAHYVRVTDPDHVDDIMMMNPTPFADRDDADAFVDELNADPDVEEEYGEEDVIGFEDFDRDLAVTYRSNFFDGDGH